MKRNVYVLLCLFGLIFTTQAQIAVKSFEYLETDLDASTYFPKKDFNGKTCAIIKVFTTQTGFIFDNGSLGIVAVEYKPAEIWVYVPEGTMKLKIAHPQLGNITNSVSDGFYWFPSGRVKSGCSYKMELSFNNELRGTDDELIEEKKSEPEKIYTAVEQMPQFPGGQAALNRFLSSNMNYPQIARENGIEGRVIVQFVVTKNGTVGEVKVLRSVDRDLDKEAIRLCKSLPKFIPGKKDGQDVNVWYTIPIIFKLR